MGHPAIQDTANSIHIFRNNIEISSGSLYIPGEIITIKFDSFGRNNARYLLQTSAGLFVESQLCSGLRSVKNHVNLRTPSSGDVTIFAAWDTAENSPVLEHHPLTLEKVRPLKFHLLWPMDCL
jgi:hypothetical protein